MSYSHNHWVIMLIETINHQGQKLILKVVNRNLTLYIQPLLVPTMEGAGGSVSPTLAAPADPPALLAPGELIKPSGKFPKPTKIPGKNYSKDEVVIRNADSGKGILFYIL